MHQHEYILGKSGKVEVCRCGAFRHVNLKPEDIITERPAKTVAERNEETAQNELRRIETEHPDRIFCYMKHPKMPGDPYSVTLWTGHYLGLAWVGKSSRSGFGGAYRRPVTTRIFGVLYHGWYFESSGDYVRLRKAKNQNGRYAATLG